MAVLLPVAGIAPSKRIKTPLSGSLPALPRGERDHISASGNAFASLNAYAKRTENEMRPGRLPAGR